MPSPFPALVAAEKSLLAGVVWSGPDENGLLTFLSPLAIDGRMTDRLELRGTCIQRLPDVQVVLQLEARRPGLRTRQPLIRLEWRPLTQPHQNPSNPGHNLSGLVVWHTHVHRFEHNWLPDRDCMRAGNLPYAMEVDDPADFAALIDFAGEVFNIEGLDKIERPLWNARLV